MFWRLIWMLLFVSVFALAACDNDEGSLSQAGTGDVEDDDDNGDDDEDDAPQAAIGDLEIGSGTGEDFEEGVLETDVDPVSSGGTNTITATVVDTEEDNEPVDQVEVAFSSACADQDEASIDDFVDTGVDGRAQASYDADTCQDSDTVTAQIDVQVDDGETASRTAEISFDIEDAVAGSLVFNSAQPTDLGLKGMGGLDREQSSQVEFALQDVNGNPIPNETVSFELNTDVGGVELSEDSVQTNDSGIARTSVKAGTAPAPVRVIARAENQNLQSTSGLISISTGIPVDGEFTFAVEGEFNVPYEGCAGATVDLSVHARDRFTNPVVDDTVFQFSSRLGRIDASCETDDGECGLTWTSQDPWTQDGVNVMLAYGVGEEAFTDHTGDGLFGDEEADADDWESTGEPFRDDTRSGDFIAGDDGFFFDYDGSGDRTDANDVFDGVLCGAEEDEDFRDNYCGEELAPVGKEAVIMVTSNAGGNIDGVPAVHDIGTDGTEIDINVSDIEGRAPAEGTTVSLVLSDDFDELEVITEAIELPGIIDEDGDGFDLTFELDPGGTTDEESATFIMEMADSPCAEGAVVTETFDIHDD